MLDSELVLWRKGEKEFMKIEKTLKFNANKQLELFITSDNVSFV